MSHLKTILVPYDFSEFSRSAFKRAVSLTLQNNANLIVLYVVDKIISESAKKLVSKDLSSQFQKKVHAEIGKLLSAKDKEKIRLEIIIKQGKPSLNILALAEEKEADLIVMGSHGRTGLKRLWLGSVAEQVVQRSITPVFIHRGDTKKSLKKILLPIDFSEHSREGFDLGLQWGEKLKGNIYLLHVIGLQDFHGFKDLFVGSTSAVEKTLKKEAKEKLSDWAKQIRTPHHLEISIGNPSLEIQKSIKKNKIDLVILSTHGCSGLKYFLMGSVAKQTVHLSSCSVLVIRPVQFQESTLKFFKGSQELDEYMEDCE